MKLSDLTPDPHNRRTHTPRNLDMLAASLRDVGAARSIVIDETGEILAGNGLVQAATAAGLDRVQVVDVDGETVVAVRRSGLTPEQKRSLALYDNRTAELAEWDWAQLDADRAAGLELGPWFTAEELAEGLPAAPVAGLTDPDAVPDARATDIVRGDLFTLGAHRLLCGDSASPDDVGRLMQDGRADCLFTSPPYNVDARYTTHDDTYQPLDDYLEWLRSVCGCWLPSMRPGRAVVWNVGVSPRTAPHRQLLMLESMGLTWLRQYVWFKVGVPVPAWYHTLKHPVARNLTSNYVHELVFVLTTADALEKGDATTFDDTLEHDVFRVNQTTATVDLPPGPSKSGSGVVTLDRRAMKAHPAAFPVKLPGSFIAHLTTVDEVVLEPFMGSGSTMMACHQSTRRCLGMEIDPQYCQVAIDRWEAFTGQRATKVGDAVRA